MPEQCFVLEIKRFKISHSLTQRDLNILTAVNTAKLKFEGIYSFDVFDAGKT